MQNKLVTSWDDGSPYDLKVAELLDKHKIPGIFYIPINNPERDVMTKSQIREIASKFEVGGHTFSHVDLTSLSSKKAEEEIVTGKTELENIIGKKITKFCFPKGKYNNDVVKLVKKAGFRSARTARIFCVKKEHNIFLESPNLHIYNHRRITYLASCLKNLDMKSLSSSLKIEKSGFLNVAKGLYTKGFHIWGHGWEIDEKKMWRDLSNYLYFVNEFKNANK